MKQLPSFDDATTLRQKAWAAELDPSYWYPVENDRAVRPGQVLEVRFQENAVALFRGSDGRLGAIENRCAHRQLKLSVGQVQGCTLTCRYHGWAYGPDGNLTSIPHELFDNPFPKIRLRCYPVQVRYGLIWVFFGDPELAERRPIPRIAELEGPKPWVCVPTDILVRAHPTAIANNIMDSTHVAALHRTFRTRSLIYGKVTRCLAEGDRVLVSHDIQLDPGGLLRYMGNRLRSSTQDACYEYPYLWVGVGDVYKLWNFMLPLDACTTRLFMLSCSEPLKIPFTGLSVPALFLRPVLGLFKRLIVMPLFTEDIWSFEAEQAGYEEHHRNPAVDLHPAILPCYQLTIRKWQEHLAHRPAPRD
jgi:nitrite reductase/ring-hydroxylating ferredoxin subunit